MSSLRFPTQVELDQSFEAYEAEMAARRFAPLPPEPVDDVRPPRRPVVACAVCGRRFDHANDTVARMQRGRHQKARHPETVEAG